MFLIKDSIPASLRTPVESSRFAQGLMKRMQRSALIAGLESRPATVSKYRFAPLPQEPEDARLTGVTRSLHRRLLALNLVGTRLPDNSPI